MAPTYGTILNVAGPGTGPVEPAPLHSNGVPSAIHRYVPGLTDLADGATFTSIEDVIGSLDLTPFTGTPGIVATKNNVKRLRFSPGHGGQYTAPVELTEPFTMSIVTGATATSANALAADGYRLQRGSTGYFLAGGNAAGTGSGLVVLGSNPPTTDTVLLMGMCQGASSRGRINNLLTTSAGTIAGPDPANYLSLLALGPVSQGISTGLEIDVLEVNIWPFFLDATQQAAHVAAMKAKWTEIPA